MNRTPPPWRPDPRPRAHPPLHRERSLHCAASHGNSYPDGWMDGWIGLLPDLPVRSRGPRTTMTNPGSCRRRRRELCVLLQWRASRCPFSLVFGCSRSRRAANNLRPWPKRHGLTTLMAPVNQVLEALILSSDGLFCKPFRFCGFGGEISGERVCVDGFEEASLKWGLNGPSVTCHLLKVGVIEC